MQVNPAYSHQEGHSNHGALGWDAAHLWGANDHGDPESQRYVTIIDKAPAHCTVTKSFLAFLQFLQKPEVTRNYNFKKGRGGEREEECLLKTNLAAN